MLLPEHFVRNIKVITIQYQHKIYLFIRDNEIRSKLPEKNLQDCHSEYGSSAFLVVGILHGNKSTDSCHAADILEIEYTACNSS